MSTRLGVIVADFRTSLAVKMAVGATTGTLQSAIDDDSVALPAGNYYFTIDGDNSQKEHIGCTLAGTALTSVVSVSRQGVQTSGAVREHRIGATVTITNFAHLKEVADLIAGTTDLNASDPLKYDGVATISDNAHLATKKYADDLAIAGAPDATNAVKGIIELATTTEAAAGTALGATGASLVPPNSMFNATSSAAVLVPVTNASGKIAAGFGGSASTLATLDGSSKVVEDPANATTTPTASKIPIADGSGDLARGWINFDSQVFTASGTWTKPTGAQFVKVVVLGAGGGGGSGSVESTGNSGHSGGAGGGGGAVSIGIFLAGSLGATETITVGTAGAGASANVSGAGDAGSNGGFSSFGTWLKAGGGGGGAGGFNDSTVAVGGGGGSALNSAALNVGGAPTVTQDAIALQGTTASATILAGYCAEWGGGAGGSGGGSTATADASAGGSSVFASGGGGGGGGQNNSGTEVVGGAGGTVQSYTAGGGGTGGAVHANGTAGSSNATLARGFGGSGGGGGGSTDGANGGTGGAGGVGAGGGGGGSSSSANGGAGGSGGRGEVRVFTW